MVRFLIAIVFGCLGAIVTAPVALGLTVIEEELEEGYYEFTGEPCGTATVRVFLPVKAHSIEVSEPVVGDLVYNDRAQESGRISDVTKDRSGRRPKVIWTAEPTPLVCSDLGWAGNEMYFAVDYLVPRRVRLGGSGARRYTDRALSQTFGGAYSHASGSSMRCRRKSSIRVRCDTGWFIGDVVWGGTVTVWLSKRRGSLQWNYRLNVTRVNEYCEQVEHGTNCRRVTRRERRNLIP